MPGPGSTDAAPPAPVDVTALVDPTAPPGEHTDAVAALGASLDRFGVARLVGHGVDPGLRAELFGTAAAFFALPRREKERIAMARGGAAWRGWFGVGDELTDGVPDDKEGLYVGTDLAPDHPAVRAGLPLHGANLFPERPAGLGPVVRRWMDSVTPLATVLLRGVAEWLDEPPDHFDRWFAEPVVLFRCFHSPPPPPGFAGDLAVGGHTDYGGLTLLAQDDVGGLEVRPDPAGPWVAVPPGPDELVCNLGDMMAGMTGGRLRAAPHRVLLPRTDRYSFPLFVDPSWDAVVPGMPGTYGAALLARVARVFPELFASVVGGPPPSGPP